MAKQSGAISRPLGACVVQSGYRCPREEGQGVELASLTISPALPGESPGLHVTKESESSQSRHGVNTQPRLPVLGHIVLAGPCSASELSASWGKVHIPLEQGDAFSPS